MRRSCAICFWYKATVFSVAVYCKSLFLKLGSAKGCQSFRETKMRNGGIILLAVQNLYVRIKVRLATFYTNNSVTNSTQTTHGY